MKKFLYFFFVLLTMASCANNEEILPDVSAESRASGPTVFNDTIFCKFDVFGEAHNHLLKYVAENFEAPEDASVSQSQQSRIDYLLSFQQREVINLPFSDIDKKEIISYMAKHKNCYLYENILLNFTDNTMPYASSDSALQNVWKVRQVFKDALRSDLIDSFEYECICEMVDYIVANSQGSLSSIELEKKIDALILKWKSQYAGNDFSQMFPVKDANGKYRPISKMRLTDAPKGAVLGVILNISKHSLSYWNDPSAFQPIERIAPWVAADAAGAIYGGGCALLYELYNDANNISWGSVGWSALTSAVGESTGLVGKALKWVRSW